MSLVLALQLSKAFAILAQHSAREFTSFSTLSKASCAACEASRNS
uniref:Uncharacterized protein n=1 Tax=Medicago truncatula TaxID=3880 RepID=I3SI40_MEDTR|nr:unknown [Medicago truncatula]